ncbi:protein containing Radical SAM domain protein [gut metagenome]|uniref:Protein containing Radical SAM domain protein n=1 Tax=gut metagenome TaxID=749906 RepID=J9FXN4_9ZZZZ
MDRIGLIPVDSRYPNLALMKISAYHKAKGDIVEWYSPFEQYAIVYKAKVFSFTPDCEYYITNSQQIVCGGTGYDIENKLPKEIDMLQPDYSLYTNIDKRTAYGFLTRGCPNKCKWCVVPKKEGNIRPYMDIEEIAIDGRNKVILMDNNILASDYGLQQIEKIIRNGIHVDFNQALDARLVTKEVAQMLAKVKWLNYIKFGCDTPGQIQECDRAVDLIINAGYSKEFFFYCILLDDIDEAFKRVSHWRDKGHRFNPYCQPFRDINKKHQEIPLWQKDMARWVNMKSIFRKISFEEYEARKGFKCKEHFKYK